MRTCITPRGDVDQMVAVQRGRVPGDGHHDPGHDGRADRDHADQDREADRRPPRRGTRGDAGGAEREQGAVELDDGTEREPDAKHE